MASSPRSSYFRDSVTLVPEPIQDKWGETVSTPDNVSLKGRIEYKYRRITDNKGNEVISNATIEIEDRDLDMDDKLVFDGITHSIISWHKIRDAGFAYLRVYVR